MFSVDNGQIIKFDKVSKVYGSGIGEIRAVNKISLCISRGELIAIVGSSGSGKSTMLNLLGCLDLPSSGNYYIEGTSVSGMDDTRLSFIRNRYFGFIFQGFNLIPTLTAVENVELPLYYRRMSKSDRQKLAAQALGRVGLAERLTHKPSELSGGQQQRVAIARAIVTNPGVILADEPTGNLDGKSGNDVMKILKSLNSDGTTVIIITHDNEIARRADRIIKISDGEISFDMKNQLML